MTIPSVVMHGGDWVSPGMDYHFYRKGGNLFAMRYIVPSITGKMITRTEVNDAHKEGVHVGLVYETSGTTWEGGHNQGLADGTASANAARSLNAPASCALYHAVDSQVFSGQIGVVLDWLSGVRIGTAEYRTGVYGQFSVIEAVNTHAPGVYRWQTPAWSDGMESAHADIMQKSAIVFAGTDIDLDVAYTSHIGQWYANPADQPPIQEGADMQWLTIAAGEKIGVPVPPSTTTGVTLYCDLGVNGELPQVVRVAVHSASKGYSQIFETALSVSSPIHTPFTEHDVDGVSFARDVDDGNALVGFIIT